MSTEQPSLEGAPAAEEADHPPASSEPGAAGKPSDGAANQDRADTDTPNADASGEPQSLIEELTGEPEPKQDEPAKDDADPADPPPQDPEAQKPQDEGDKPEDAQQQKDQKPAQDDGEKPLDPKQEQSTPKFARNRIKNLERQLEASRTALGEMEQRAIRAGYQTADSILEAIDVFGRAIHRRDPQALADLDRRLQAAGLKREAPAPAGIPPAKVRELLKAYAYDELERLATEAEASPPAKDQAAPAKPPAQQPPAKPEAQEQPERQPQNDPEVIKAIGAMQVLAEEIKATHKDAAQEILAEINAEVQKADARARDETGVGLRPNVWASKFRNARDAILARRREAGTRRPPTSLRSSATASNRQASSTPLTDELLSEG